MQPVDVHTHIFPPEFIEHRGDLADVDPWFRETYGNPKAKMVTAEELAVSTRESGYRVSVAVGWPWRDPDLCQQHNEYLAESSRRFPDAIRWMGIINPVDASAADEISRCKRNGAVGIGELNADGQGFDWRDVSTLEPLFAAIRSADLPLLVHASEPVGHLYPGKGSATPEKLLVSINAAPDIRWVLAHWGGGLPFYDLMKHVRAATANVWYDTAASTYLYDFSIFKAVVAAIGSDRILYGTDYPLLKQARFRERVEACGLAESDLANIFSANADRLLNLSSMDMS